MNSIIYVLHERESMSHFLALEEYAKSTNKTIKYREFSISRGLIKSILKFDINLFNKQIINLTFLCSILFTENKTIIIGIAPLDWRLYFLRKLLKKHKNFYFTSWVDWSGQFFPKSKLKSSRKIRKAWRQFLENQICGVFSVTKTGLIELQKHYNINCPCSVVNHSFTDVEIGKNSIQVGSEKLRLIYVGRLIKSKGIFELLELASNLDPNLFELTIVGEGELKNLVSAFSKQYSNIFYKGFIGSKKKLFQLYKEHDVQLLFSKRTEKWEELFGMVIIEAMANSVITISTDHAGPLELIDNKVNGFIIVEDKNTVASVKELLVSKMGNLQEMKLNAYRESKKYDSIKVALKWKKLLDG